jgi:hypothetical protein
MPKDPGALLDIELYNNRYKRLVESMLAELDRELISLTEAIRSGRIAPAQKAQVILAERQRTLTKPPREHTRESLTYRMNSSKRPISMLLSWKLTLTRLHN